MYAMPLKKTVLLAVLLLLVFAFVPCGLAEKPEKTPFGKYPFIIPLTAIAVFFAVGFWLLSTFYQKKKFTAAMIASVAFLALLVFSGASGLWLLFLREVKVRFFGRDLKYWHAMGSYLMVFFAIIHFSQGCFLITHSKAIVKKVFNKFKR
jgi:predicted neutral ceramidase superfamily lipid hydrolase